MSVGLLVSPRGVEDPHGDFYIPVAAESTFRDYWIPGCEALQLQWVPLFQTGIPVRCEHIPAVIAELEQLRVWMTQHPDQEMAEHLLGRMDRLLAELQRLQHHPELDVFIG